jgi:hypothetical protein
MGFIKKPEPIKLKDADTPVEEEVCVVVIEDEPVEEVRAESKPKSVITSTASGEQFGTWIPILHSSGNISIDVRNSFYTKTGQLVTCTFDILVTDMSERNNAFITLNGLPMSSISSRGISGSAHLSYFKIPNNEIQQISGTINSNDNRIDLWGQRYGRKGLQRLTQQDIQIDTVLAGTVTYITNS